MIPKQRAVILGGSFNPPTIAHSQLLTAAMQTLDANIGIFVPSSDNYVTRKMAKNKTPYNHVFSEITRHMMLTNLIRYAENTNMIQPTQTLQVWTGEFGDDGHGHTFQTLCQIQKILPEYEIIFIVGADKLSIMPKWHKNTELFQQFSFGVASRNDISETTIQNNILKNQKLSGFAKKFHILPPIGDMSDVSSSKARKLIDTKEWSKLENILCPETIQHLQQDLQINKITMNSSLSEIIKYCKQKQDQHASCMNCSLRKNSYYTAQPECCLLHMIQRPSDLEHVN